MRCQGGIWYAVAEWYGAGLVTARSRVRIPPTAAVYQRQLSVPSLRGRLMSIGESWGVNGHTTRCTSPVSEVLRLRLVSGWGLQETEISAAPWALRLGKGLYFTSVGLSE